MTNLTVTARGMKSNRTQWAAQFLVAAELVRRKYIVSFTMGNSTPMADLMVGLPSGEQFWVDVKGVAKHNSVLQAEKPKLKGLHYVVVNVADEKREEDEFYILTQEEFNDLIRRYATAQPRDRTPGFTFKYVREGHFRDKWETLPH